jgi:TetR/AcrR family transcriptional repressor of mexJK operon
MARPSKRDDILQTASKLFIENGYQAVSMDQIALAVPVSKPTLYSNFKDKRDLFMAVVAQRCEKTQEAVREVIGKETNPEKALRAFASHLLDLVFTKASLQLHRTMVGDSEAFPDMARMFYETGPMQMRAFLMRYLQEFHDKKLLHIPNPALSADLFLGMIKGRMHLVRVLGIEKQPPSKEELDEFVGTSVQVFLKGHSQS